MLSQVVVAGQVNRKAEVLRTMGVRRVSLDGEYDPIWSEWSGLFVSVAAHGAV